MGNASWSSTAYSAKKMSYTGKSREQIFQKKSIRKDFDPCNITIRESCDSEENPLSTALIFALDVTGSMGFIAEEIARDGLGTLVEGILERQPVTDPHLMMMAIGDINYDNHPLQITQFEADIRISDQLEELYLEGGGGGNHYESYDLAWAFAASKTEIDCFNKRGKKGYIFTIGDEMPPTSARNEVLKNRVNIDLQSNMETNQILDLAKEKYDVFHIVVEEGSYCIRGGSNRVYDAWTDLLGKRVIMLDNHRNLPQVAISVIMVNEGIEPSEAISVWDDVLVKKSVERALFGPGGQ